VVNRGYTSWRESVSVAGAGGPAAAAEAVRRDVCTDNTSVAVRIERYLLDRAGWVSTDELCQAFGLRDGRVLRSVGDSPGLCSGFAISGNDGFKHVENATSAEWLRFKHRLRRHGIAELVRVHKLDHRRQRVTRSLKRPAVTLEKDSNQILMAI
jgi:hypothetical protein